MKEAPSSQKPPSLIINIQSWATPIIALVMLLVGALGGYFFYPFLQEKSGTGEQPPTPVVAQATTPPTADPQKAKELMEMVVSQTRHFRGNPDAPVVVVEFSDFQWPFCGRHAAGAGRQIEQEYVENDKVRLGYHHFAFLGEESVWAAEASECAADQDAFWEYHDLLFARQTGENQGNYSKDNLKKYAEELGLNTTEFNDCLDSGKYTALVEEDNNLARQIGVRSTPAFLLNGTPIIGAQPFENFKQVIESLLSETESGG